MRWRSTPGGRSRTKKEGEKEGGEEGERCQENHRKPDCWCTVCPVVMAVITCSHTPLHGTHFFVAIERVDD